MRDTHSTARGSALVPGDAALRIGPRPEAGDSDANMTRNCEWPRWYRADGRRFHPIQMEFENPHCLPFPVPDSPFWHHPVSHLVNRRWLYLTTRVYYLDRLPGPW